MASSANITGNLDSRALPLMWLIRLRWAAVAAQIAGLAFLLAVNSSEIRWREFAAVIAVTGLSNFWLRSRIGNVSERLIGFVLAQDTAALSALLYLTGGAGNPFSVVYLLHVALAAMLLSAAWAWTLAAASSLCFGALFFQYQPLAEFAGHHGHGGGYSFHLYGMWVAFVLVALFLAFFMTRLVAAFRARDIEVQRLRLREERFAALTTIAAGAAHELGTPLSTIAVIAGELSRDLARAEGGDSEALEDVELIRSEVRRCREILDQLCGSGARGLPAASDTIKIGEISAQVMRAVADARALLDIEPTCVEQSIHTDPAGLVRALISIVRNALEASGSEETIRLRVRRERDMVRFSIEDRGIGMTPEQLERLGEPFRSTKPVGQGMGLGVFLARTFAERFGGALQYRSAVGQGTVAELSLPAM